MWDLAETKEINEGLLQKEELIGVIYNQEELTGIKLSQLEN